MHVDLAKQNCYLHVVDCGVPLSPANGDVTVSGTAEGDVATFQCEDGLILSEPSSTCTDTGQTGGQWTPNPVNIQCRDVSGNYVCA